MGNMNLRVLIVEIISKSPTCTPGSSEALPGFTVVGTATLAAARKAVPFDLALVDVYLPDGSGIDFVHESRCDSIVLSASTEAETIRAALSAGALSYLVKPSVRPNSLHGCPAGCALPPDPVRQQPRRRRRRRRPGRTAPQDSEQRSPAAPSPTKNRLCCRH